MNLKQSIDKILHQWPAKVICLIIAIFIYVFHQVSLIDKKTFTVPLTIQENGLVMHVGSVPNSVSVVVRTSTDNMKLISVSDINATVNLDTIVENGVYDMPIRINISDNIKVLDPLEIRLKDDKVIIEVDKKSFKYVPIQASVVGDVAQGYQVENIAITPSTVKISGPETMLSAVDTVYTSRLNVSNAEVSFSNNVELQTVSKLIEIEDESEYIASVFVTPVIIEKEFIVPVDVMNLKSSLDLKNGSPVVTIKLAGTMNYLEDYHVPKRSIQVYAGDILEEGTYELPLRLYFPNNLEIIEKSSETVTLEIVDKTSAEEKDKVIVE